ncbi:MAG: ATP-binding protein [Ramlibacter sp.]
MDLSQPAHARWPAHGTEMGELVRHMDWSATELGPIDIWPAALRIAVSSVLDAQWPTIVLWGPQLVQVYNDAYRELLGPRHPAAMGQPTRQCWPEVWDFNLPLYGRVMATGERIHFEDQEYVIEPSGVPESRFFTITYSPARDESGTVCGVVVVALETTQRLRAQREGQAVLKATEFASSQLRALFDQAPSFMALLAGPEHVHQFSNAAHGHLLGGRDVIGKSMQHTVPEAQDHGLIELLDAAYASGEAVVAFDKPVVFQNAPGAPPVQKFLDFVYQPIKDAQGVVSGIFVIGTDVTEKKLATEALALASARKDEFLAMLAHELRNPLAPVAMVGQILKRRASGENQLGHLGGVLERQVAHMRELLESLLDISRVAKGLINLHREAVDLHSVLESAAEQARPALDERRHRFQVLKAAQPMTVTGDPTRLTQVFANLLNNAAKYTPHEGNIVLEAAVGEGQVQVTVHDNGLGLSSEFLPQVFEIFAQAQRPADQTRGGLGLGLSLVKNLVELHGGNVTAASDGLGRGSRFTVCLPLRHIRPEAH